MEIYNIQERIPCNSDNENKPIMVTGVDKEYFDDDDAYLNDINLCPPQRYSSENEMQSHEVITDTNVNRNENTSKCKLKNSEDFHYDDVGEEIYINIHKDPDEELGITLICGEVFTPSWPAIIDIKAHSPASKTPLKIGDQIKELLGIDTGTITHWKLVSLFSKAVDEITMTVRRALDRSETAFDWYKHPFSSVRQSFEELVISDNKRHPAPKMGCACDSNVSLRTFKLVNDHNKNCLHEHNRISQYVTPLRTLSLSNGANVYTANNLQRRRHTETAVTLSGNIRRRHRNTVNGEGKFIADEIEKLQSQKVHLAVIRQSLCSSSNSVASTMSDSTASSFSSSSSATCSDVGSQQGGWIDHTIKPAETCTYNEDVFDTPFDKSILSSRHSTKSPGAKLRDSIRRKISKNAEKSKEEIKYALKCKDIAENTLLLTVWIVDRRKLGLQLGGGSVSAYGDSNVKVTDIKKNGSGYKIFKIGDELLEVGGASTNGLSVYDVNCMISKLEGQYVEFKIFRPKSNN